jgi:hypothetical protein
MQEEGTRSMAVPGHPRCIGRAGAPLIAGQGVYLPADSTRKGSLNTPTHTTSHPGPVVGASQEGECSLRGMLHAAFLSGQVIWAQYYGGHPLHGLPSRYWYSGITSLGHDPRGASTR